MGINASGMMTLPNGVDLAVFVMSAVNNGAWIGGAWKDYPIFSADLGDYTSVNLVFGYVLNGTGYTSGCGLVHRPAGAALGADCAVCRADVTWPCTVTNALRLASHAKTDFLTLGGSFERFSTNAWFGSTWPEAAADNTYAGTWPAGFTTMAFSYNGSCMSDGTDKSTIGKNISDIFSDQTLLARCIDAAEAGGGWVRNPLADGTKILLQVTKLAKSGQFYFLTVPITKEWAPWNADCSASYAGPCSEENVLALVGMAAIHILASRDTVELSERIGHISERTDIFDPSDTGDFSAYVLDENLDCVDDTKCHTGWPQHWMTAILAAVETEEGEWASLPAYETIVDIRAFVYQVQWMDPSSRSARSFIIVSMVDDVPAPIVCEDSSDCPANAACSGGECICETGYLANYTKDESVCGVLLPSTMVCRDVTGLMCDGQDCSTCPRGYYCVSGNSLGCPRGSYCPDPSISTVAIPCPAGTMGMNAFATNASTCSTCPAGTYSNKDGSTACAACAAGTASSEPGATECERCDIGTYQDQAGSTVCASCVPGRTTNYRSALSVADCVCPRDSYEAFDGKCLTCPEGMVCPQANSTVAAISVRIADSDSSWPVPTSQEGYMTLTSNGLGAYKCKDHSWCPGGIPGTCAANRDPATVGCSRCLEKHYTSDNGSCTRCNDANSSLLIWGAVLLGMIGLSVFARMVNKDQVNQPNSITTAVITLGLSVSAVQTLGIFSNLTVRWVDPVKSMFKALLLFSFDLKVLQVECMVGQNSVLNSTLRQCVAPASALFIAFVVLVRKVFVNRDLEYNIQVVNAVGAVFQLFFVSIFVSTLTPFICYEHPNGLGYSMVGDPAVLCTQTGAHGGLVAVSLLAVALVVLPYLSLITFATVRYRSNMGSSSRSYSHLRRFRFLFFRHSPDCYWYGLVTLLRGTCICLLPVVARDVPSLQILGMAAMLQGFCTLQLHIKPWRSTVANMMDAGVNLFMALLLVCVGMSTDFTDSDYLLGTMAAIIFILVFVGVLVVFCHSIYKHVVPAPYFSRFICHHKADAAAQARFLQTLFVQRTGQTCFLDSDHLTNLEELFDIVRCRCGELCVYLTSDTLRRPWCAGEITIAWQVHGKVTSIFHPSFIPPIAENLEASTLNAYLAMADFKLVEYGITDEAVVGAFRWLLNENTSNYNIDSKQIGRSRLEDIANRVAISGNSRHRNMLSAFMSSGSSGTSTKQLSMASPDVIKSGTVVFSSLPEDDEATATVGILLGKVQASLVETVPAGITVLADMSPDVAEEAISMIPVARAVVVILSPHTLKSTQQLQVIYNAMAEEVACIPVSTPNFRFPTQRSMQDLRIRFAEEASGLEMRLQLFFKIISLPFTTYASDQVLSVQAESLIARIPKRARMSSNSTGKVPSTEKALSLVRVETTVSSHQSRQSRQSTDNKEYKFTELQALTLGEIIC